MSKVHNFSAGPSILAQSAFEKSIQDIKDFAGTGLSILEVSHRGKEFEKVMAETEQLVRDLLNVSDEYDVLFLQGGASTQFFQIPLNFLKTKAAYTDTGTWAGKAIVEAKGYGDVAVVASSKDSNYTFIPKDYAIPADADYFHCTSNNTIYGTQIQEFPKCDIPLICDMSSDIFSRVLDFSKFDLIYAGAQKNMGPAGATLVVVKTEILGKTGRTIPSMLDYQQIAKLIHVSNIYHIREQELLADKLCEVSGMDKVFFCNSGCEANEASIKLARLYGHQRGIANPEIIVMEKSFHGLLS